MTNEGQHGAPDGGDHDFEAPLTPQQIAHERTQAAFTADPFAPDAASVPPSASFAPPVSGTHESPWAPPAATPQQPAPVWQQVAPGWQQVAPGWQQPAPPYAPEHPPTPGYPGAGFTTGPQPDAWMTSTTSPQPQRPSWRKPVAIAGGILAIVVIGGIIGISNLLLQTNRETVAETASPAPAATLETTDPATADPAPTPDGTPEPIPSYPSPEGSVTLDEPMHLPDGMVMELRAESTWETLEREPFVDGEPYYVHGDSPSGCWFSLSTRDGWQTDRDDRGEAIWWLEGERDFAYGTEDFQPRPPVSIAGPDGKTYEFAAYFVGDGSIIGGDSYEFFRIDTQTDTIYTGELACEEGVVTEDERDLFLEQVVLSSPRAEE